MPSSLRAGRADPTELIIPQPNRSQEAAHPVSQQIQGIGSEVLGWRERNTEELPFGVPFGLSDSGEKAPQLTPMSVWLPPLSPEEAAGLSPAG